MSTNYFYIDLELTNPKLHEYSAAELKEDMIYFGARTPMELSDYDFRVFNDLQYALDWVHEYFLIKDNLKKILHPKPMGFPCMLYKRRYIVQTLMGEKLQTVRNYHKQLQKGDTLTLHDQTYFLPVTIKNVRMTDKNEWTYYFEPPKIKNKK